MKYIVDIHGEIEGDYDIIGKYEERPTGEWESEPFGDNLYHYCPNCGARMNQEQEEQTNEAN